MVSLSKEESLRKISLRKDTVISLAKERNLSDLRSRVALVLDFSGSMSRMFSDGTVQSIIERIIPLALNFDDNGELDFWIFENDFKRLDGITLDNFYGLAQDLASRYNYGGTNYAPVMRDVLSKYCSEEPAQLPSYVIFITDGDNFDKAKAEGTIKDASSYPIFWQFIGIGGSSFSFLEKLDDMGGRYVDNADFFAVKDINAMSDEDLYSKLLEEFPTWLHTSQVQEMIANPPRYSTAFGNIGQPDHRGLFGRLFGGR